MEWGGEVGGEGTCKKGEERGKGVKNLKVVGGGIETIRIEARQLLDGDPLVLHIANFCGIESRGGGVVGAAAKLRDVQSGETVGHGQYAQLIKNGK